MELSDQETRPSSQFLVVPFLHIGLGIKLISFAAMTLIHSFVCLLLLTLEGLGLYALAAPTGTSSSAPPESLLGYNPDNVVINANTDDIQYELAPGQTDAANIAPILDFNNIENPQPIHGTKGGLDPGPRTEEYNVLNPGRSCTPKHRPWRCFQCCMAAWSEYK